MIIHLHTQTGLVEKSILRTRTVEQKVSTGTEKGAQTRRYEHVCFVIYILCVMYLKPSRFSAVSDIFRFQTFSIDSRSEL